MNSEKIRPITLSVSILIGFIILVMFVLAQLSQKYSVLYTCGCAYTLPVIIILLSGTGIVVGALTYYFLSQNFEQKRKKFDENKKQILQFLENDEKIIIDAIIKNKGSLSQSSLSKKLMMDRVKIFRTLEKLEQKKIIKKEKTGKTNKISLSQELQELLL